MVTVHASVAHIKRLDDEATRAHHQPRCDAADAKPPAS